MSLDNKEEFDDWFGHVDDSQPVAPLQNIKDREILRKGLWQHISAKTLDTAKNQPKQSLALIHRLRIPIAVAASLLLTIGIGYLVISPSPKKNQDYTSVKPGREAASLTLSDGRKIILADSHLGQVASEDGLVISKTKDGELRYELGTTDSQAIGSNTLTTSNGETYTIKLPDGTLAKLNAASSVTYPVNFGKTERRLKMTGEVYFEVAKRNHSENGSRMSFFVETEGQNIQVLGTHFNVNAYRDKPFVKTTLVEGSVRVSAKNGRSVVLLPGQQSTVAGDISVAAADMESQLAWINGDFVFKREELQSILLKISRWYDVEIDCPSTLGQLRFTGMVSRKQPLSDVMEMISSLGKVKLSLKERRLIVTP